MNRCYSLAFDAPGPIHTGVRVFGHGALLGKLLLRNDERPCFEALFYDDRAKRIRHRLKRGEIVQGGMVEVDHDRGYGLTTSRFGVKATEDSWVVVEPEQGICQVTRSGGQV